MKSSLMVALTALATTGAVACPLAPGAGLSAGGVQLMWTAEPQTITAGKPFVLNLRVCPAQAQLLVVDATMPEHRHGMNYRPSLKPLGDGRWRAEGLLWHMSGRWELRFDIADAAGAKHTLRQSVTLP